MTETAQKHVERTGTTGTIPIRPPRIRFIDEKARAAYENSFVYTPEHVRVEMREL